MIPKISQLYTEFIRQGRQETTEGDKEINIYEWVMSTNLTILENGLFTTRDMCQHLRI